MQDVIRASNYDSKFYQFYLLDEDFDSLEYRGYPIFDSGITNDNKEEFLIKSFLLRSI